MSPQDIETLKEKIRLSGLDEETRDLLTNCVDFSVWMPATLQEKNITIANLRRALFGAPQKKKPKKNDENNKNTPDDKNNANSEDTPTETNNVSTDVSPPSGDESTDQSSAASKKGHGRLGHTDYPNAKEVFLMVTHLKSGDGCPFCQRGKIYKLKIPKIIVRVTGNSFANTTIYKLESLRCNLCLEIINADLPGEVSPTEKYDPYFKAQLSLQKYYVGVPFHRQETLQRMLHFPLPDSTQFELCEDVADCAYPVVTALEIRAANGQLIHNDDTTAKILSVITDNAKNPNKKRTGMFTTGIMAKGNDGNKIALFYTGVQHAGENLDDILQHRVDEKEKMIQMCDALSANMPKTLKTIVCNCLSHAFRKFRDLMDFYPQASLHVMTELGKIYEIDERTRGMSDRERLKYHRQYSKPIMFQLYKWLKKQFRTKAVEPNSSLGKSIKYMLKHWKKLRRFLTTPGAPIDNNIVERALKIPIRVRKGAMFYKTLHGATISNILTSLIMTASLCDENPVDYLVALQENKAAVFANPDAWIPWRYRATLEEITQMKAA